MTQYFVKTTGAQPQLFIFTQNIEYEDTAEVFETILRKVENNFNEDLRRNWLEYWVAQGEETILQEWNLKYKDYLANETADKAETSTISSASNCDIKELIPNEAVATDTINQPVEENAESWLELWQQHSEEIYSEQYSLYASFYYNYYSEFKKSISTNPTDYTSDKEYEPKENKYTKEDLAAEFVQLKLLGLPTAFVARLQNNNKYSLRKKGRAPKLYNMYFSDIDEDYIGKREDRDRNEVKYKKEVKDKKESDDSEDIDNIEDLNERQDKDNMDDIKVIKNIEDIADIEFSDDMDEIEDTYEKVYLHDIIDEIRKKEPDIVVQEHDIVPVEEASVAAVEVVVAADGVIVAAKKAAVAAEEAVVAAVAAKEAVVAAVAAKKPAVATATASHVVEKEQTDIERIQSATLDILLHKITNKAISPKIKKNRKLRDVPAFLLEEKGMLKYWRNRFSLFSRYDHGIRLDRESWFSVTPEKIAVHIAERLTCDTIIDGFCGCGGNAIQFASTCRKVIAIDIDPLKLEMAKHNAGIYGVADKIDFMLGDFLQLIESGKLKADVVFLSPPWGGPMYKKKQIYDIERHLLPVGATKLFEKTRNVSENIAIFLPRTANIQQVIKLAGVGNRCEIEHNYLDSRFVAITALYGDTIVSNKQKE